jgi:hypothetical protein
MVRSTDLVLSQADVISANETVDNSRPVASDDDVFLVSRLVLPGSRSFRSEVFPGTAVVARFVLNPRPHGTGVDNQLVLFLVATNVHADHDLKVTVVEDVLRDNLGALSSELGSELGVMGDDFLGTSF